MSCDRGKGIALESEDTSFEQDLVLIAQEVAQLGEINMITVERSI